MIELYLIRHGLTDWNLEKKMQGTSDILINDIGVGQAESLGHELKGIAFEQMITSPLARAYKTAEILNGVLAVDLVTDQRLAERDYGALTGRNVDYVNSHLETVGQGIESTWDFRLRCDNFINYAKNLKDGKYIAVTHGAVIIEILSIINKQNYSWDCDGVGNCSITKICVN